MIKVSELRYKNLFILNGLICEVAGFHPNDKNQDDLIVFYKRTSVPDDSWKPINSQVVDPIPLTPALLYSAGFSTPHDYMSTVVEKGGVMIDYHLGKFRLRDNSRITIDHLHQLQNLYFALTGEELTINNEHLVN